MCGVDPNIKLFVHVYEHVDSFDYLLHPEQILSQNCIVCMAIHLPFCYSRSGPYNFNNPHEVRITISILMCFQVQHFHHSTKNGSLMEFTFRLFYGAYETVI